MSKEERIISSKDTFYHPICNTCRFYISMAKCKAFPNGIPEEIIIGENGHTKPTMMQIGKYVYTKK